MPIRQVYLEPQPLPITISYKQVIIQVGPNVKSIYHEHYFKSMLKLTMTPLHQKSTSNWRRPIVLLLSTQQPNTHLEGTPIIAHYFYHKVYLFYCQYFSKSRRRDQLTGNSSKHQHIHHNINF